MAGKKIYNNIPTSFVYCEDNPKEKATAESVATDLEIELICDIDHNLDSLRSNYPHLNSSDNEWIINYVRLALFVERAMAKEISKAKKDNINKETRKENIKNGYEALSYFWRYVKQYSYFADSPAARGQGLVNSYEDYRNLTARLANMEADGILPSDTNLPIPDATFSEITYNCSSPNILYGSQMAELTCRLKILRSVVDHILSDEKTTDANPMSWIQRLPETILNSSLHGGINELRKHIHLGKYPHFWQIFIYVFGGCIIEDHKEEEYELLSHLSGIPVADIPDALSVFDILFSTPNGWLVTNKSSNITHLKHVPASIKGISSLARYSYFCRKNGESLDSHYSNYFAKNDMRKWARLSLEYIKMQAEIID